MFFRLLKYTALIAILAFAIAFGYSRTLTPSNSKNWVETQKVLAHASVQDNLITINDIRNFRFHATEEDFTPSYYTKTFDLNKLTNIYYIVERFSNFKGEAHTFISFEFEGGDFLAITIEARREVGQEWNPITGLLNQMELVYIIADERDALRLRTNTRGNEVYAYPVRAEQHKKQQMFMEMVSAATHLKDNPKFYNTLTDSCTTSLVKHINSVTPNKLSFNWRFLLPGYSGKLAYDLGMIETELPFEEAEARYYVSDKARQYADSEDFSVKIREGF